MIVPHSRSRLLRLKIPVAALLAVLILWGFGTFYVISIGVQTAEYRQMNRKLSYFSSQFLEMRSTLVSLQQADEEFTRLFSLKSKKKVLEAVDRDDTGSLDIDLLRKQVAQAMVSVKEIRRYVDEERDIYFATPVGWPVPGALSSPFGKREHPRTGEATFHSGVDIRASMGTPVKATADGVVSVSGWVAGNGNIVVIEHGHGFNTAYAHNKQNLVKVGQRVKRGDTIALSGATGVTTGPHLHYEVWKQGRQVNPISFLEERS
jgi:murein DD-endopeptidase MepM/ murein hydrolase activator NlpD